MHKIGQGTRGAELGRTVYKKLQGPTHAHMIMHTLYVLLQIVDVLHTCNVLGS